MGQFHVQQKIRGKYEASAEALLEAVMRSLFYTLEAELGATSANS